MAERQIDIKTAVVLVSVGMTLAGGGGTVIGARAAAMTEARVDKNTEAINDVRRITEDHEARIRSIEREFLMSSTEIKADLKYIKAVLAKWDKK